MFCTPLPELWVGSLTHSGAAAYFSAVGLSKKNVKTVLHLILTTFQTEQSKKKSDVMLLKRVHKVILKFLNGKWEILILFFCPDWFSAG